MASGFLQRLRGQTWGLRALGIFLVLVSLVLAAELWIGKRALLVIHRGSVYLPFLQAPIPGSTFGQDRSWETDYRELAHDAATSVLLPLIPWGPLEIDLSREHSALAAPNALRQHYLGTDHAGRDVLARWVYGLRVALLFAAGLCAGTYVLATLFALLSVAGGRWFDALLQRLLEVWSHLPFLYIVIGTAVLVRADILWLLLIMIAFSWTGLCSYIRAALLREMQSTHYLAAQLLGLPTHRLWLVHLLPQLTPLLLTFLPFTFAGALTSLTALDYLGFGIPPPLPSWGELLQQGFEQPQHAMYLVLPVIAGMIVILTLTTLIGEASRKAMNPQQTSEFK